MSIALEERLTYRSIARFFVPLGLSACLVTISHVIIQSTLARSASPEATIAGYTIAMSVFQIAEKPAVLLRQTCSALVQDQASFRAVANIAAFLLGATLLFGAIVSYTPAGDALFKQLFNADGPLYDSTLDAYRILMFVTLFSGIRCLYHGIIIRNRKTKWLTIGMLIRLGTMYLVSLYFIHIHKDIDAWTGALIFLAGMMVEAAVSFWEGRQMTARLPAQAEESNIRTARDVLPFYRPLVYSSFLAVIISPSINAMLGKTADIQLAVASYALALSVTNLTTSFFTYVHQIVLNFYKIDSAKVNRFAACVNMIPGALVALLAFTPLGRWFLQTVIGAEGLLLQESLDVLRLFVPFALAFPWVDYFNGQTMLNRRTKIMVYSQTGNVAATLAGLSIGIFAMPEWNGSVGAFAQSFGLLSELIVLATLFFYVQRRDMLQKTRGV